MTETGRSAGEKFDARRWVAPLLDWYAREARDLPWRRTQDPYAVWVSEVMLQQTQVRTVIPYWERWMREFPTVAALAGAPEERVLKLWEGLGYYRRARALHQAARQIVAERAGRLPEGVEGWLELPGIGRYTAGAIASIAGDEPAPILDGNVIRVLTRWMARRGDPARGALNAELWDWAGQLVRTAAGTGRPRAASMLNQSLMELGALVCTPRHPQCGRCPVAGACAARALGTMEAFPETAARPVVTAREFLVLVLHRAGEFWVRQRPAGVVNGGFWEFPNFEPGVEGTDRETVARAWYGVPALEWREVGVVRHSITRYRIVQRVWVAEAEADRRMPRVEGEWRTRSGLEALAFTRAHRRIADQLEGWIRGGGREMRTT